MCIRDSSRTTSPISLVIPSYLCTTVLYRQLYLPAGPSSSPSGREGQLNILEFRIEMIAEPIAHKVHRQYREHDCQAREHRDPPGRHNQLAPIRHHQPPGWRWTVSYTHLRAHETPE